MFKIRKKGHLQTADEYDGLGFADHLKSKMLGWIMLKHIYSEAQFYLSRNTSPMKTVRKRQKSNSSAPTVAPRFTESDPIPKFCENFRSKRWGIKIFGKDLYLLLEIPWRIHITFHYIIHITMECSSTDSIPVGEIHGIPHEKIWRSSPNENHQPIIMTNGWVFTGKLKPESPRVHGKINGFLYFFSRKNQDIDSCVDVIYLPKRPQK